MAYQHPGKEDIVPADFAALIIIYRQGKPHIIPILETLITNDFDLAKELFRQCYFLRWNKNPILTLSLPLENSLMHFPEATILYCRFCNDILCYSLQETTMD